MCGRYYIEISDEELRDIVDQVEKDLYWDQLELPEIQQSIKTGEIYPSNIVPVKISENEYKPMKWGFTSFDGKRVINARSESAFFKPMFKKAVSENRCLIPASYYFEWSKTGTNKQKYSLKSQDGGIIYFAGCYRSNGSGVSSFVILTRDASSSISFIHNRMPVIIPESESERWLKQGAEALSYAVLDLRSFLCSKEGPQLSLFDL